MSAKLALVSQGFIFGNYLTWQASPYHTPLSPGALLKKSPSATNKWNQRITVLSPRRVGLNLFYRRTNTASVRATTDEEKGWSSVFCGTVASWRYQFYGLQFHWRLTLDATFLGDIVHSYIVKVKLYNELNVSASTKQQFNYMKMYIAVGWLVGWKDEAWVDDGYV